MGQSGGRSSGHPTGRGAVARSTPRQRDRVDNPPGEERESLDPVPNQLETIWMGMVLGTLATGWLVLCTVLGVWLADILGIL